MEVKGEPFRSKEVEKERREIEGLNPGKVKYEILETERENLKFGEFERIRKFIYGERHEKV